MKEYTRSELARLLKRTQKRKTKETAEIQKQSEEALKPENYIEVNKNIDLAVQHVNRSVVQRKFWAVLLLVNGLVILEELESKREDIDSVEKLLAKNVLFNKYVTNNIISLQVFFNEKQAVQAAETLKGQIEKSKAKN